MGGYVLTCSIGLCRRLLQNNCPILMALGKRVAYEIVVGLNGRVWVNAASQQQTIMIGEPPPPPPPDVDTKTDTNTTEFGCFIEGSGAGPFVCGE